MKENNKLEQFRKALSALDIIYAKHSDVDRINIDATIKRFEFTFELCWKVMREWLYTQGLEVNSPRAAFQQAYANKIITNEELWLNMLKDRNLTSHTYDELLADQIYKRINHYIPMFKEILSLIDSLNSKNENS